MVYITLNCGLLKYDVWTIKSFYFEDRLLTRQKLTDLATELRSLFFKNLNQKASKFFHRCSEYNLHIILRGIM